MDPSLQSVLNKMGIPIDDQAQLLSNQISNYQSLKAKFRDIRDKSNISVESQKDLAVAIAYFDSLNVADPLSRFDEIEWMVFYAKYPVDCGINTNVDNDIEIIEISSDDEEVLGDNDVGMKRPPVARKKISSDDEKVLCAEDDDQGDNDVVMKRQLVARKKMSSDDEVIVVDDDKQNDDDDGMKRPTVADDDGKQNDDDDDMKRPTVAREKISSDDEVIVVDDGKQNGDDNDKKRPPVARKKISLDNDMKCLPVSREKVKIPKPTGVTSTEQQQDSLHQDPNTEETLDMFEMADQGFDVNEDIFSAFDADEEKADTEANPIRNLSEVEFEGRRYKKRQCYYIKSAKGSSIVVGIRSFLSESEAYCVRVVHTCETFLGITKMKEEACIPNKHFPFEYVQLKRQELICLSKLGELVVANGKIDSPPESLPDWIYEPRIGRSRRPFGYTRDRSNMPSNVTRTRRPGREFRVLEGFTGAGGMHLGFKEEGFHTAMAVEYDDDAVATFKLNNPDVPVYHGDINEFTKRMRDDEEYSTSVVRNTLVTHTSSPCQGFSTANRNVIVSDSDHRNNELSMRFVDWLRLKQPLIGSFENVVGMWRRNRISWLRKILVECLNLGYQVRVMVLNAADYGDPQKRQRLIIFAAKNFVMMPNKPVRTHGSIRYCNDNDNACVDPFVTIGDVFEHLRKPYAKTYPNMKDCKTTSFKPGESEDVFQLDYNGCAPTMKCASTCLHYAERVNSSNNSNIVNDNDDNDDNFRCINVRECAAIQSFPYNYEFVGKTLTSKYKQAGNAVPVRLAAAIARTIRDSLLYYYQEELLDIQKPAAATTTTVNQPSYSIANKGNDAGDEESIEDVGALCLLNLQKYVKKKPEKEPEQICNLTTHAEALASITLKPRDEIIESNRRTTIAHIEKFGDGILNPYPQSERFEIGDILYNIQKYNISPSKELGIPDLYKFLLNRICRGGGKTMMPVEELKSLMTKHGVSCLPVSSSLSSSSSSSSSPSVDEEVSAIALPATEKQPDFGGNITATAKCIPMDLDDAADGKESDCVVGNQKRRREK